VRELVTVAAARQEQDRLFGATITLVTWRGDEALQWDHDLQKTVIAGNIVPVTQARTVVEEFSINGEGIRAIARLASGSTAQSPVFNSLYPLQSGPLVWCNAENGNDYKPDISLIQVNIDPSEPVKFTGLDTGTESITQHRSTFAASWDWAPDLLGSRSCPQTYTLDPCTYTPVDTVTADGLPIYDYYGDSGTTIRFGEGTFGQSPEDGATFQVTYRIGGGSSGNVGPDTITEFAYNPQLASVVERITNPIAASGGLDEESSDDIRLAAPFSYREKPLNVVLSEDYQATVNTLGWVKDSKSSLRWNGAWHTWITSVDPQGPETLSRHLQSQATSLLNDRRVAGLESFVIPAHTVSYDLHVTIRIAQGNYPEEVIAAVVDALSNSATSTGNPGFFFADNFTFGTALERSRLESAIQNIEGVAGVSSIKYKRSGDTQSYVEMPSKISVGKHSVLRINNDIAKPTRGLITVTEKRAL
jgi:hypothetical protein